MCWGKRVTVNLKDALQGVLVDECVYVPTQEAANALDFSFVLCKSLQSECPRFPSWTGFNILLHSSEIPILSKIGYLPIIDAPLTEMSTINAIMKKSMEVANKLCISYVLPGV